MGSRLRKFALTLLFAAVLPLSALTPPAGGAVTASCPTGTHWDTITQTCQ